MQELQFFVKPIYYEDFLLQTLNPYLVLFVMIFL